MGNITLAIRDLLGDKKDRSEGNMLSRQPLSTTALWPERRLHTIHLVRLVRGSEQHPSTCHDIPRANLANKAEDPIPESNMCDGWNDHEGTESANEPDPSADQYRLVWRANNSKCE